MSWEAATIPAVRAADTPLQTTLRPRLPVDLGLTLWPLRRGTGDPCMRAERPGVWWRATQTPAGPATARYATRGAGVEVVAWGPGAEWCLASAPELVGARDSLEGFAPHGLVARLHHAMPGLRISRSLAVFEALVPSVLEQKVAGAEARPAYRRMVWAWGTPAPGPCLPGPTPGAGGVVPGGVVPGGVVPGGVVPGGSRGAGGAGPGWPRPLRIPPRPEVLAAKPYWEFHRFGVEMRRADTIRAAAAYALRVEETVTMAPAEAHRRLRALPGVGPWTSAEVALVALGDADAVSVGDYHLPHLVSWALAGEPRGSDERMLELLAPYSGHRGRVLRLLAHSGVWAPRFGPRMPLRSFTRF
jgi:3-methyladenine DNA glycosylase/8-oxoguanine DNA glycosylase